jgi:uncharacterized membrane protein
MKGGKIYLVIFIAIAIAVFLFTQYPSLNIENFESEGISWWVWLLIFFVVAPIVLFVIQVIFLIPEEQKHQANMAELSKKMKENTSSWGGARNRNNKHRK